MIAATADCRPPAFVEPDLLARLRIETADAHQRLEAVLDIPRRAPDKAWMIRLLERFYGFHRVWEPAVAAQLDEGFAFDERRRLARLETDLTRLGREAADLPRLPVCLAAHGLAGGPASALGSLYVLEGSTLGGQVIARMLAGQAWPPAEGIGYFQPYGAATGAMWRALREALARRAAGLGHGPVIAGAQETFRVLHDWLGPACGDAR